ncbi:hypothetical protein Taro_051242 [Colocasia esculenta]|uniref:Tetratricopeptide repeat protein SKI3 n=1 Tax=Colocasia esculenta TaxID=4460 RepID=A0A843XFG6_COLES|nr:hypothetical protein [Colocasia esculenta]
MPEGEGDDQLRRLQEAVDSDPESPSHHYAIGLYLWKRGEEEGSKELKERAVEHFVVSAKLNPSNAVAFRYLGHYYSRVSVDEQRATKCYLRTVNLNPEDSEAGESLCNLLDGGGKESLEISVCKEVSERSPKAFWALRRIGYLLVHQKKWSEAVQSLQQAIRGYPTCADLWETLGLAYQHLGMFTAAIKGVEQFRRALEVSPENVSAHFGLASALLGLSKECISYGAFIWATSLLKIAYAKCFPWVDAQDVETNQEKFESSIHCWEEARISAAKSANSAYQRALHLTPWQANLYTDVANSVDLIASFEERNTPDLDLSEKMALGSLMLEGVNSEFWVALGCLSHNDVLKQHALIRGLQLDISLSVSWAYLGKLYRNSGNQKLAKQAFDHARSIDPSLALPWAGMSVGPPARESSPDEAYESCLRAVQMLPLPEFQVGLGKLAALSGHLLSSQVFGAIQQAVQRAPHYPETHNLMGLVCESRLDYHSAIAAYRNAKHVLNIFVKSASKSQVADVSVNLARSLCQAGYAFDAELVCEELKRKGLLDNTSHQLYIIALWQQGKKESFLTEAAQLAKNIKEMDRPSAAAALVLICRLVYYSLGEDHAVRTILKSPRELFQISKMSFLVAALCAFDLSSPLHSLLPDGLPEFSSEEVNEMHCLTALSKMLANESCMNMGIKSAQHHLRKALHLNPNSILIRKQLGSLLLCSKDWMASHIATRCVPIAGRSAVMKDSKSTCEILGSASVACYSSGPGGLGISFPTCEGQFLPEAKRLRKGKRKVMQADNCATTCADGIKAREEKFPQNLCATLKRLISSALSENIYSTEAQLYLYQKFQLLLCDSEIYLQSGDYPGCISQANKASELPIHDDGRFFAHLQLCRGYAALEDWQNLRKEYMKCLQHRTCHEIGWISLKYLESKYQLQTNYGAIDLNFAACLKENELSRNMWTAVFDLLCSQSFVWNEDLFHAEEALTHACSMGHVDSCLLLCHGAICMELARQGAGSHFLSLAVDSLNKARETSPAPLPIISSLLAQAVGSSGANDQWRENIRSEWFSWPADVRPAELYFQMHFIAGRWSRGYSGVESSQTPERWVLRAIHINPSSMRYWKALRKLMEL